MTKKKRQAPIACFAIFLTGCSITALHKAGGLVTGVQLPAPRFFEILQMEQEIIWTGKEKYIQAHFFYEF